MKLQELITKINELNLCQTEYPDEQEFNEEIDSELSNLKVVDSGLDVDKHRWYETSVTVYKHPEGFFGIRYVTDQFSEMSSIEDHYWDLKAFEMEEVSTVTYKVKK